jgi:hypothetical protein
MFIPSKPSEAAARAELKGNVKVFFGTVIALRLAVLVLDAIQKV